MIIIKNDLIEKAVEMYRSGSRKKEIIAFLGCSNATFYNRISHQIKEISREQMDKENLN